MANGTTPSRQGNLIRDAIILAQALSGELDVLIVLHPSRFAVWHSTTVMAARVRRSLTVLLWQRLFGTRFLDHPLQERLPQRHTNGHRLTVRWFFEERATTRTLLASSTTTGDTLQGAMIKAVAQHFGQQDFLWSLPQPKDGGGVKDKFWNRGRGPAFKPALRLSGKSHGQNIYRSYTRLALLSVINFTPNQYDLLLALGLTQEEVDEAHAFTILYQDLARSAMRDAYGDDVELVVPCLPSAMALAAEFEGCAVMRMPDALIPQKAGTQKRGSKPQGQKSLSPAERQRKRRAKKRAEREGNAEREREAA